MLFKQSSIDGAPEEFFDPNKLSEDGTIALQGKAFSDDGSLLAYGLSESGSDWNKIKIRDVESGKDFPDVLTKVKFSSMSWTHDNKGLFYCVSWKWQSLTRVEIDCVIYCYLQRYPDQDGKTDGSETQMNENQKLYYHRVGESQDKDVLVVDFPENPSWRM